MADLLDIIFLRHGRSRADDEGVLEGRYDAPLTEVGQTQALARADSWRQSAVRFDCVICSTLQRARTTAEIMANQLKAPIEDDPDWMEVDHGALAGLTYAEADQRYPRPVFRGPYERIAGNGESEIDLRIRAARAVQAVVRRGPGRYLVVAHGGILNAALQEVLGMPYPINNHGARFRFAHLGYAHLTYDPTHHIWVMLEMING